MLNTDLYSIYTTYDEYRGRDREYFYTFEEAIQSRMKYNNWWSPMGDVYIRHYDKTGAHYVEEWHIDSDGTIKTYFNFK